MSSEAQLDQNESVDIDSLSLFDRYAEQVVTFKGVTGPIGALVKLCPVPIEQMEPQKVEEWTASILTQSGIEIPDELMPVVETDAKKKLN